MAKITRATVKSFIRKNWGKLHILRRTEFDGMCDCVMPVSGERVPVRVNAPEATGYKTTEDNLGVAGAWFVGHSRDYFTPAKRAGWEGIEVYNACGSFELLIPAAEIVE